MTVPDLGISWSHTYTSDDIIEVPGYTVSLPGIFSAGVYVQVGLSDQGSTINMKVSRILMNSKRAKVKSCWFVLCHGRLGCEKSLILTTNGQNIQERGKYTTSRVACLPSFARAYNLLSFLSLVENWRLLVDCRQEFFATFEAVSSLIFNLTPSR